MSYIYIIKNKINNKVYIGKTSCFLNRQKEHLRKLKRGNHVNKHLQSSYNKYERDTFEFEILEICCDIDIDNKEKYWISFYNSTNEIYGYNLTHGGEGGVMIKQVREKQSKSQNKNKKKVYGFSLNGNLINIWNSIKECSKELSVNTCDIRRTIFKKQYSCKGYILQNNEIFDNRQSRSEKSKLRLRNLDGTFK